MHVDIYLVIMHVDIYIYIFVAASKHSGFYIGSASDVVVRNI